MKFYRAALAAAFLLFLISPAFSMDVLMGRYDAKQTSSTPEKITLPIALKWEYTANRCKDNPASPIVAGNTCYFACGDAVYAVDLESGSLKWKYPSDRALGGNVRSTPAFYNGNVFFGAADKNLYCIDASAGTFKWAYPVRGAIRCAPVIVDGVIYFGADDDSIYAIDADTGETATGWAKPFTAKDDVAVGLAVSAGMLIASSMDGCIYGLGSSTGKLRTVPFRLPQAPTRTSPIVVENMTVMAVSNSMLGLSLRGNQLRWQVTLPSEVAATPASVGNDIYVPCRDKKIYAYNVGGRQPVLKWIAPADLGAMPLSSPTVADDTVYVTGSKGVIAAFSAKDGSLRWRYVCSPSVLTAPGSPFTDATSSPTVANGAVLVLTDDGVLHCFAHDAPDNELPKTYDMMPVAGTVLSSAPPIKLSCTVYDIGSGVDFSKVSMMLDKQPVENPTIDPFTFSISYSTDVGGEGRTAQKLQQGPHTVTINAEDYKGNQLSYSWTFLTDDSLPPPKRPAAAQPKSRKTTMQPKGKQNPPANPLPPGFPNGEAPPPPPPPPAPGGPGQPGSF